LSLSLEHSIGGGKGGTRSQTTARKTEPVYIL
jgi:hypothetical protein